MATARRRPARPYADGQTFSNLFVLEFDADGRCRSFTEWFMEYR